MTIPAPSVRELMEARRHEKTLPGMRNDPHTLALVIEGGGMRGVIGGGMMMALQSLGLTNVFDAVYGTSAGAMAGAYLLAGQSAEGTSIYYQNICNKAFINPWRLLSGKPMMSLEYLIDHVMVHDKPLDTDALLMNPVPLYPVASCHETSQAVALGPLKTREQVFAALHASARIPFIAGDRAFFEGKPYWDGCVTEPVPIQKAIVNGATHVLTLTMQDKPMASVVIDLIMQWGLRHSKKLRSIYKRVYALRRTNGLKSDDFPNARVDIITPAFHRLTSADLDPARLRDGTIVGARCIFDYLGMGDDITFPTDDKGIIRISLPKSAKAISSFGTAI